MRFLASIGVAAVLVACGGNTTNTSDSPASGGATIGDVGGADAATGGTAGGGDTNAPLGTGGQGGADDEDVCGPDGLGLVVSWDSVPAPGNSSTLRESYSATYGTYGGKVDYLDPAELDVSGVGGASSTATIIIAPQVDEPVRLVSPSCEEGLHNVYYAASVDVTLSTDDGALNESFSTKLRFGATLSVFWLEEEFLEFSGTLDVQGVVPAILADPPLRVYFETLPGADAFLVSGQLSEGAGTSLGERVATCFDDFEATFVPSGASPTS